MSGEYKIRVQDIPKDEFKNQTGNGFNPIILHLIITKLSITDYALPCNCLLLNYKVYSYETLYSTPKVSKL